MTRLAVLLVILIGCTNIGPVSEPHMSGTSDESPAAIPTTDAGLAGEFDTAGGSDRDLPTSDEFCQALAEVRCAGRLACCADPDSSSTQSCRLRMEELCRWELILSDGNYSFDAAAEVLAAAEEAARTCDRPRLTIFGGFKAPRSRLAEGDYCTRIGGECDEELYCNHDLSPAVCRRRVSAGESCRITKLPPSLFPQGACTDGLYCDYWSTDSQRNPNPVCRSELSLGEACDPDDSDDACRGINNMCNESGICAPTQCDEDADCGDYACRDGGCTDELSGSGYHCL